MYFTLYSRMGVVTNILAFGLENKMQISRVLKLIHFFIFT